MEIVRLTRRADAQRGVRVLALAAVMLISSSVHSLATQLNVPAASARPLRHHHLPIQIHRRRDQTAAESFNWSGYAVLGAIGSVSDVKSSWIVPSVASTCGGVPEGYAAFWAGIDGWNSSTVEQIGTDSDCVNLLGTKTATPTYYAWFEFYPQDAYLIGQYSDAGVCQTDCVAPGDVISAEVKFDGMTAGALRRRGVATFTVTITDETQGWSFTTSSTVPGARESSAEWVAETPYGCDTSSGFCELSDFVTAGYGDSLTSVANTSYATVGGVTRPIGGFGTAVQEAVMVSYPSGAATMAEPSALESGGSSFTDTWGNAGP